MATVQVKSPNSEFTGWGPGDVEFRNGVAEVDSSQVGALAYYREHGYTVGDGEPVVVPLSDDERAEAVRRGVQVEGADPVRVREQLAQQPDSRVVGGERQPGTPLRDAAVDPRPGDFLPPTNAGQADPHGPAVVSPGLHGAPPAPITPGPVSGDPAVQEQQETALAEQVLVDGQDVPEATAAAAPDAPLERPSPSASKPEWVAFARAVDDRDHVEGVDHEALTKAQLVAKYGDK